jgi:probable HAF family extracellular repeat protein
MNVYVFTNLDDPSGTEGTNAFGISANGLIVGEYWSSNGIGNGFLYNGGQFTTIDDPLGVGGTVAVSVNDSGQIIGFYYDSSNAQHGFLYNAGTYTAIDDPSAGSGGTFAESINASGQIVGGYFDSSGQQHGFVYNGSSYTTLDDPMAGSRGTAAYANNSSGQIVGEYWDNSGIEHGFLYSNGTFTTLDDPLGAGGTIAFGINDADEIVGYYIDSSGAQHGFLYNNGTYTTIDNALGSGTTQASWINASGQIVGYYADNNGLQHGFLATPTTLAAPAATSVQQEVLGLYLALYNRAADFPGYSFWINVDAAQADSGGVTVANANTTAVTLNDAALLGQAFVNTQSTYFNATYANLDDNAFINALYVNIGGNAGDPTGIAFWAGLLAQAEATGQGLQAARAGLVGQFVHDLIDINLTPGAAALGLTAAQFQEAVVRQINIDNKIDVSLAYSNASQQPGGAILVAQNVGDAAFNAAIAIVQGVTSDPSTVSVAVTGINNAVAHQDLSII